MDAIPAFVFSDVVACSAPVIRRLRRVALKLYTFGLALSKFHECQQNPNYLSKPCSNRSAEGGIALSAFNFRTCSRSHFVMWAAVSHETGDAIDSDLLVLCTLAYLKRDMSVKRLTLTRKKETNSVSISLWYSFKAAFFSTVSFSAWGSGLVLSVTRIISLYILQNERESLFVSFITGLKIKG